MVKTQEEDFAFENLKHANRLAIMEQENIYLIAEHQRKLERLEKYLEIAKAGGKFTTEE